MSNNYINFEIGLQVKISADHLRSGPNFAPRLRIDFDDRGETDEEITKRVCEACRCVENGLIERESGWVEGVGQPLLQQGWDWCVSEQGKNIL